MDLKIVSIAGVFVLIIIVVVVALGGNGTGQSNSMQTVSQSSAGSLQTSNSSAVLFVNTQYAQYSYQILPGPLSAQAKAALAGFNLSTTNLSNGSTKAVISIIGTSSNKTITMNTGYKLYIVETSFGDDGYGFDSSLGDDGFVVVDKNGYVVA